MDEEMRIAAAVAAERERCGRLAVETIGWGLPFALGLQQRILSGDLPSQAYAGRTWPQAELMVSHVDPTRPIAWRIDLEDR